MGEQNAGNIEGPGKQREDSYRHQLQISLCLLFFLFLYAYSYNKSFGNLLAEERFQT